MSPRRPHRFVISIATALICVAVGGCLGLLVPDSRKTDSTKSREKSEPASKPLPQSRPPVVNAAADQQPPAVPPQNVPPSNPVGAAQLPATTPPVYQPPANAEYIHLSAGAALPLTLPQGETLSFSAEYRFTGGPKDGVRYAFVVQGRGGKTIRVGVPNLKSQGQLPAVFSRAFRSTDGPFRGYIEEWPASSGRQQPGDVKRVSNIVPLS